MTDLLASVGGGYRAQELLHRRGELTVARGVLVESGRPVIIKRVIESGRHGLAAAQLRCEHAMLQRVAPQPVPEIVAPLGWVESEHDLALLLEDIGGHCLERVTASAALSVDRVLAVAQGVARALARVHAAGVVHGRVTPRNIVYNPTTGRTQLIDFGAAAPLPRTQPFVENVHTLAAALPFIAPEQTGLGPRWVDARSDLHALGTTLYKLLTGLCPYPQQDIGSWIAALLTQDPPSPCAHVPEIPPCVAAVVCKLLQRAPEQRYQTAHALELDLQACATALAGQVDAEFPLGTGDAGPRLGVPQALVGRAVPLAQLRAATARARAGAAVPVLVVGACGTGKTALMAEERRGAFLEGGLCLWGAHNARSAAVPLSGVGRALAQLVRFIAEEPDDVAQRWTDVLRHAAGDLGGVLVQVAPPLAALLGPVQPLPEVAPAECRRRLLGCLQRFVLAACEVQPLTLVLDDMQWTDSATLALLPLLLGGSRAGRGLAVVCAVEAEDAAAPGAQRLAAALKGASALTTLPLRPLDAHSIQTFLGATLGPGQAADPGFIAWAQAQTGGVPLRLAALLTHLLRHDLVHRQPHGPWALRSAASQAVLAWAPEHLVQTLPEPTRQALAIFASAGGDVRLTLLAAALECDRHQALQALAPALAAGVLLTLSGAHRLAPYTEEEVWFRFVHPSYAAPAAAALDAAGQTAVHARLSVLLRRDAAGAAHPTAREFLGAVHANLAYPDAAALQPAPRLALARLNLRMGRAAKQLASMEEAALFLRRAEALLAVEGDATRAPEVAALRREIMLQLAEAESLTGAVDLAEARLAAVLSTTSSPLERARVHQQRCAMHAHVRHYARAIAAGLAGLRCLGVPVRAWPQPVEAQLNRRRGGWAPSPAQVVALLQAPRTEDAHARAVAELCEVLGPLCFFTRPALFRRLLRVRLRCLLRWGTLPAAAGAYAGLTWLLMRYGRVVEARAVSERGLELNGRPEEHPTAHLACMVMHASAVEWLASPSADMLRTYRKSYARCLEVGDVLLPGFFAVQDTFLAGLVSQERVAVREARYAALHDASAHGFCLQQLRAINRCMRGVASPEVLAELEVQAERRGGYVASMFYASVTVWHCLFSRPVSAVRSATAALRHGAAHHLPEHVQAFLAVFAGLACVEAGRLPGSRRKAARGLRWALRCLHRASTAPGSLWSGAELLVRAHQEAYAARPGEAARLYERANEALPQVGASVLVGLGWECVARFYLHQGLRSAAQLYLCKARRAYEPAAPAKMRRIEEEFPGLLTDAPDKVDIDPASPTFQLLYTYQRQPPAPLRESLAQGPALSETLRAQPTLEALEACICELLLRHGGATRVVIAREMGGGVVPVAQRTAVDGGEGPIEALPMSILGYTVRTGERVLINDAMVNDAFSRDPYLLQARPRSLASLALADGSRVWGVAYLENALLTHAFGRECMAFVGFILGEAGPRVAELQTRALQDSRLSDCALSVTREAWQALDALRAVPHQHATLSDVERPLERILQLTEELTRPAGDLPGQAVESALERRP